MSLWICDEHGLYGGQLECPKCGRMGHYADIHDELDVDIAEIAARDGAAAGDKYLTPAESERHAWDDLFDELASVRRT